MGEEPTQRADTAESQAEPRWTRREIATLVVATIGVVISLLALVVSLLNHGEETTVKVEGVAVANTLGSTPMGYGIRVSIINDSLRPVIVKSLSLYVDGVAVAPAEEYLPDPRRLNDQSTRGDEPLHDAEPLPLAIPARGARTIAALLNFTRADEIFYARRSGPILKGAKAFCRQLLKPRAGHRVEMRAETTPGGVAALPVKMIGPLDGGNQWYLSVKGPTTSPSGVLVHRKVSASSAVHLITVSIWRSGDRPVRRMRAPVFGPEWAQFPFPALGRGSYRITLSDGNQIVAGGTFSVPLKNRLRAISPSSGSTENVQCALFGHPELRAVAPQPLPAHPLSPSPG